MTSFRLKDGVMEKEIFCRFITRKGKRIYPKKGQFFHFWVALKK